MAKKKIRKHGEGTLFQRRDGRWQASFVPKSGGKRRYVYGKTKSEALDKLRLAQEEDRKGLKPGYVNLMHRVLRCALGNAVRWGLVARNVASLASAPQAERYEGPTLTVEQAHKLIESARGNRMETILTLAVLTGMRRGEICALRWADIDFHKKVLYGRQTVNRYPQFGLIVNDPKSKSSRRKIVLTELAIQALQQHRKRQEQERLQAGDTWTDQGLVFTDIHGGQAHPVHAYSLQLGARDIIQPPAATFAKTAQVKREACQHGTMLIYSWQLTSRVTIYANICSQ